MIDKRPSKARRGSVRLAALALAVGVVAVAIELYNPTASAGPTPPTKAAAGGPLSVDVVEVELEPHAEEVIATGQLAPAEAVEIVSELSRRLLRIRVDEGASVKEGQVLFEVDASELYARHARLKVQRDLAKRVLARRSANAGTGAVSTHELDVARTEVEAVEAEMREIAVQLDKSRIRAPFAGVVGKRLVSEGAWLTPNVVLTTLYDTSHYKIDFTLPERYASLLAVGAPFTFSVNHRPGKGEIAVIEPSVDPRSRSVRVRGVVEAAEGLVAGSFASVTVPLATRMTVFVPTVAVEASTEGHTLWIVEDDRAVKRKVEIGERTPERIEIVRGLSAGDRVITSNLLRLKPDAPVAVRK